MQDRGQKAEDRRQKPPARAGNSLRSAEDRGQNSDSTCQNCRFSRPLSGLAEPTLICENKADARDKCLVVHPAGSCANFDDHGHSPAALAAALAEGAKLIPLTQGKFAIVDADDYDWLNKYKWCAAKIKHTYYATRKKKHKMLSMHRLILDAPPNLLVDHINHNGLDNRRKKLRLCSNFQNLLNRGPNHNSSSKYKGVYWEKAKKKFRARITLNRKSYHLGFFDDEIEAAIAYDIKAMEFFGEFAYLNFPNLMQRFKLLNTDA